MSVADYTSKIKDIYDSLASIDVNIEEGEMVQVCLGDLSVADHMTCHKEWFSYLEKPMQPGALATEDDTPHPIVNVGEVPLSHVG